MKKKPMYRAYVVEDLDDENSFWTDVGSVFAHEDKKGFNILLKALPLDGRLVLRRYREKTAQQSNGSPAVKEGS